ncbi:D(1B) dopamine receptor-like isoform X2 [Babylonia areolata]
MQPQEALTTVGPESTAGRHHHHGHLLLALVHILMALWAWLANVTQMVNVLQDAKLRRQPRTALILSISVSELVVAGFLCPLYTDSLVRGPWRHGLLLCSAYEAVFYLQVCVSSLAVLVFNVERFYYMAAPHLLQAPSRRGHATALLTSLPWLIGLLVVVPVFTRGTQAAMEHVAGLHHRTCVVQWDRTLHIVTVFIVFLAPSFLMLATAVTVLLLYVLFSIRTHEAVSLESGSGSSSSHHPDRRWSLSDAVGSRDGQACSGSSRRGRTRHHSGMQELEGKFKKECVLSVCLSTFLAVGLQFPFFTLLLLQVFCQPPAHHPSSESSVFSFLPESSSSSSGTAGPNSCQFSDTAWTTCMMLGMAKPGLLPLVWLVYSDIRAGFSPRACGLCWWGCWRKWWWWGSSTSRSARRHQQNFDQSEAEACYTQSQPSLSSQMTIL